MALFVRQKPVCGAMLANHVHMQDVNGDFTHVRRAMHINILLRSRAWRRGEGDSSAATTTQVGRLEVATIAQRELHNSQAFELVSVSRRRFVNDCDNRKFILLK